MTGKLVLVGTPIGNLGDISRRQAEALGDADFIAAEDTRVALRLLNHLELKKPLISYFEHNKRERGEEILRRIEGGENCALITDAGMPAISDPGEDLVALCAAHGITVSVVPGPCAAVSALTVSGLPAGRFCFEGFLSVNRKARRAHLASLADEPRTMIFYEAPHKLRATLDDLFETFGDRRVALVRELTKLHEEVVRTTLSRAADLYTQTPPRGEFVLIVEGRPDPADGGGPEEKSAGEGPDMEKALAQARAYMEQGLSRTAAVKRAARETGAERAELYRLSVRP